MKAMLASFRSAAVLGAILVAAGCSPTVNTHGHRLDPSLVGQIEPGVTSREQVARLLGSPSSMSTFDDRSWYYVTQKTEQMSFYQSSVEAQDVVRIDFDESGVVRDVSRRGLETARAIEPAPEKTRTLGNELTVVQQFIGNIGRFNSTADAASAAARSASRPGR